MPGAPNMKMYSRDDLMNMQNFGDEDEDDDEADFPSKLVLTISYFLILIEIFIYNYWLLKKPTSYRAKFWGKKIVEKVTGNRR